MSEEAKNELRESLDEAMGAGAGPSVARVALAFLGGLVPGLGGPLGAAAAAWSEAESETFKRILNAWLKLQEDEIREIGVTLAEVLGRLDTNDERLQERIESPEYLRLVKKCFRDWSAAESEAKRRLVRNLLVSAASTQLTSDDVVSLFIEWIGKYSEPHFAVIREVYKNEGISRGEIWENIHGEVPRDDSAEADLFRLLIHDLNTGRVIRQYREVDFDGNFLKAPRSSGSRSSGTMVSAFDLEKPYVLTELGRQFVHYTMTEIVAKIENKSADV